MNSSSPLPLISSLPLTTIGQALGIERRLSGARSCTITDNRTDEQRQTHCWAIVARDNCLSGWGGARGGTSRCGWACHPDVNTDRVSNWAKSRTDMRRVALVNLDTYRPPTGTAHFHIYVCNPDHIAAKF